MKLLLRVLIDGEGYFTLDYFNSHLETFELGYMESSNRPTVISPQTLRSSGNSLKQNGMYVYESDSIVI